MMLKKLRRKPRKFMVSVPQHVWEQLWKVVDAARMAVRPFHGQEKDDALEFLADQEKMLRRAVGIGEHSSVEENEETWRAETGVEEHPYVTEMRSQNHRILEQLVEENDRG